MFIDLNEIENGFVTDDLINRVEETHIINIAAIGHIVIVACKDKVIHKILDAPFPDIQEKYKDKYAVSLLFLHKNDELIQMLFENKKSVDAFMEMLNG